MARTKRAELPKHRKIKKKGQQGPPSLPSETKVNKKNPRSKRRASKRDAKEKQSQEEKERQAKKALSKHNDDDDYAMEGADDMVDSEYTSDHFRSIVKSAVSTNSKLGRQLDKKKNPRVKETANGKKPAPAVKFCPPVDDDSDVDDFDSDAADSDASFDDMTQYSDDDVDVESEEEEEDVVDDEDSEDESDDEDAYEHDDPIEYIAGATEANFSDDEDNVIDYSEDEEEDDDDEEEEEDDDEEEEEDDDEEEAEVYASDSEEEEADEEEDSDGDFDREVEAAPAPKRSARGKQSAAYNESSDEDDDNDDVDIAELEDMPRRAPSDWSTRSQLPTKTNKGSLVRGKERAAPVREETGEEDDGEDAEMEEEEGSNGRSSIQKRVKQDKKEIMSELERQEKTRVRRQRQREAIATDAAAVMECPEENLDKVKAILNLASSKDVVTQQLALISLAALFCDIIPGYRIREMSKEEKKEKVSKDVKQVRDFEQRLLSNYQRYLKLLDSVVRRAKHQQRKGSQENIDDEDESKDDDEDEEPEEVDHEVAVRRKRNTATIAIKCMCRLLVTHPHFNFRANLVSSIVPKTAVKDDMVALPCCDALKTLFTDEKEGEATLEAVRLLTQLVKTKGYNCRRDVLNTFLALHFREDEVDVDACVLDEGLTDRVVTRRLNKKAKKAHQTRTQKRDSKKEKELNRELQEAESVQNKAKRKHTKTETLKSVFMTYFRVLKKSQNSPLLPTVLQGLAKFSHFINVDFQSDLIAVLAEMLDRPTLAIESRLRCVVTAFHTLKLQGHVLNVDLKDFYGSFYKLLLEIPATEKGRQCVPLVCECVELMLVDNKRNACNVERSAAFTKRLCTIALSLPQHSAIALMWCVRRLLRKSPKLEQMLEAERDHAGSGNYHPEMHDPEHSNAQAATLWELEALSRAPHPALVASTSLVLANEVLKPSELRSSAQQLYRVHNSLTSGGFNPPVRPPPKNPTQARYAKLQSKNLKASQRHHGLVFVHPSTRYQDSAFLDHCSDLAEDKTTEPIVEEKFKAQFTEANAYAKEKQTQKLELELTRLKRCRSGYEVVVRERRAASKKSGKKAGANGRVQTNGKQRRQAEAEAPPRKRRKQAKVSKK